MRELRTLRSDRRTLACLLASVVFIFNVVGCGMETPRKLVKRPGILLIAIDSLRADHVGSYGYAGSTTPVLDALARDGARFEHAVSPSSSVIPSVVTLHTSLPPEQHRVVRPDLALSDDAVSFAELLSEHGFETAAFVEGAGFPRERGLAQGFNSYVEQGQGVVDAARDWLRGQDNQDGTRPFFLYVQLASVAATTVAEYDANVRAADGKVGTLLGELETMGIGRDTLVIATSLRGHEFGHLENGATGHSLRTQATRIPLIAHFPARIKAGLVIPQLARLMDIGSTVLMFGGVPLPSTYGFTHAANAFSMRDLAEMLIGEPRDFEVIAAGDLDGTSRSFLQRKHKVIRTFPDDEIKFYNIELDPEEQKDIAKQEERRATMLARKLESWRSICAQRPSYAVPYSGAAP
jgi:arylsulfatase A-like enzyme